MFKRVTKRAERREQAEKLGATDDMRMQDTDSDESDSDEGDESSDDSQNKQPTLGKKRKHVGEEDEEEEEDAGTENEEATDEDDTEILSSMTVKEALKSPLEGSSCIVCPGKQMKNPHMEKIHLQSGHHKRRLKRFEALVERLSSKFEDVYEDQAALLVRLLEKPNTDNTPNPADGESNRAKKKRKYEAQKEKRKLKRESRASKKEPKEPPKKRKKTSDGDKQAKALSL